MAMYYIKLLSSVLRKYLILLRILQVLSGVERAIIYIMQARSIFMARQGGVADSNSLQDPPPRIHGPEGRDVGQSGRRVCRDSRPLHVISIDAGRLASDANDSAIDMICF